MKNLKIEIKTLLWFVVGLISVGCSNAAQDDQKNNIGNDSIPDSAVSVSYGKEDLRQIKWIEGSWKGMYNQNPFYEIYEFVNDSILKITSYDWNGKDSSNSSYDFLRWENDAYYLGKNKNWKVTGITVNEIKMMPLKASNNITWKFIDNANWDAILVSAKGANEYHMQRFEPFKK